MRRILAIVWLVLSSSTFAATPISSSDTGTFVILGKDRKPTSLFYRLTLSDNVWKMEGKENNKQWKYISCENLCQYNQVTDQEATTYLPNAMRGNYDMSCIKNIAQAFCRYTLKSNRKQGGYAVIGFVTGQPIPILLQRVADQ